VINKNLHAKGTTRVNSIHTGLIESLSVQPQPKPPNQEPFRSNLPIKMVLAYDGEAAFHAAKDIYRAVIRKLTAQFEFRDSWWRFDAFAEPASLDRAVDLAADADLVFCCPNNPYALPRLAQDWIRLWLSRRIDPDGAFVLLLPVMAGNSSRQTLLEKDLRETARVSGLTFFAAKYMLSPQLSAPGVATTPVVVGEGLDAICVVGARPDVRHWGINE
jgi:hypothetical protein